METAISIPNGPAVEKLSSPIHSGDWHDKPLKWNVVWRYEGGSKNQLFATRKDADKYARIWKRLGMRQEIEAINAFQIANP